MSSPRKKLFDSAVARQVCCLLSSARSATASLQFIFIFIFILSGDVKELSQSDDLVHIHKDTGEKEPNLGGPVGFLMILLPLTSSIINQISYQNIHLLDYSDNSRNQILIRLSRSGELAHGHRWEQVEKHQTGSEFLRFT